MKPVNVEVANPSDFYTEIDSGAYQLILRLALPATISVGALGSHRFPSGVYIYTGRASRGLSKRIERHLRKEKKLRWHIDYLVGLARIEGIRIYPHKSDQECSINNRTVRGLHGSFPVKGFGSSDCRCASHLTLASRDCGAALHTIVKRMSTCRELACQYSYYLP